MTTLVTGGGGFIGSHLVDYLLANTTEDVRILDNFSTGSRSNLSHLETDRVSIVNCDIREQESVRCAVEGTDAIFHLAAAVGVQKVVDNPLESLEINLRGTENVLEVADAETTPVFIASSSEVYGKSDQIPFSEESDRVLGPTTVPRWGYASAKAIDEFLGLAYHDERGLPIVVGRYFNIVGPRQTGKYGMVVPRFIEQARSGQQLSVYGDGTQQRSFTHVSDAVEATFQLLQTKEAYGEVYNIGAPNPTTINDLAEVVIEATGSDSTPKHIPFEEVYSEDFEEPDRREPDVSKLRDTIGWVPDTDLAKIINDMISNPQSTGETHDE